MNKTIYGMALFLVLGATAALATPGGEGNNTGCNGVGNPNSPCEQTGGNGGGNGGGNPNQNSNNSTTVDTSSNSDATAVAAGGSSDVDVAVGVQTGATASGGSSHAQGGSGGHSESYARGGAGGDSSSVASVGDSVSSANSKQALTIIDDSVYAYQYNYEDSAASAASVYSQVCMNGGSGQTRAGGFTVNNQDVVCEHLKVAAVMREAYVFEMKHGVYETCEQTGEYELACTNKQADFYLDAYHEHLNKALTAMEVYEDAGLADKVGGALIRPLALIGALIWLL